MSPRPPSGRRASPPESAGLSLAATGFWNRLDGAIARAAGLAHEETLTGFKWISRAPGLVYGFEEALGYLVNPETVRDKR